jgi:S-adenosylmethionine:tRNA ribosyltransferase-isomerase
MSPRRTAPKHRDAVRLLAVDPIGRVFSDATPEQLPELLEPGDVVVVNDAATLPASLFGEVYGAPIEARLAGYTKDGFRAVLFGAGDWRTRTEDRLPPPAVVPGDRLSFGDLEGMVQAVSPLSPRLLDLEFDREGAALWEALYSIGRPVQYSYMGGDLDLETVQTSYSGRPFAFEMPSAGRPLSFSILSRLRAHGVGVVPLQHAAGLSATGDDALDALLPLPEQYVLPVETVAAIEAAHAGGHRVIAVGTTVVRALEGCFLTHGALVPGEGITNLVIDERFVLQVIDGLVSGIHDPTESHYRLLRAFADDELLRAAVAHAESRGYHNHELGDLMLLRSGSASARMR